MGCRKDFEYIPTRRINNSRSREYGTDDNGRLNLDDEREK